MSIQFNTDENIMYNGQHAQIERSVGAYITVVTEDGQRISVPKDSPLLSFGNSTGDNNYEQYLDDNKQKIKEFKHDWNIARDAKWDFISQIGSFWRNLGLSSGSYSNLDSEQRAQLTTLQEGRSDAITAMNRASTGVISTVHDSLNAIYGHRYMS